MPKRSDDLFPPEIISIMGNKNMKNILIFCVYVVLSLREVFGESQNEIKRGLHPYMAIVYYSDVTIVDSSGARFTRSALLIRPDWLISSSLETNDTRLAFPKKTLLARAGAIVIDSNFTLNEDEEEQEREVIRIVKPTSFTAGQWWYNDITLLKTLVSFKISRTVALTTFSVKRNSTDKTCNILVFAKKSKNATNDRFLMNLNVELLPSSTENCGLHFRNDTMVCASNSDENKKYAYEPEFCYGNSGGPLLCEGEIIGLQTYIGNNCNPPYLYQLLSAWDDFITCGVEEKCQLPHCANFCVTLEKDKEVVTLTTKYSTTMPTSKPPEVITADPNTEDSNDDEPVIVPSPTVPRVIIVSETATPSSTAAPSEEMTTAKRTTIPAAENEEKSTENDNVTGVSENLDSSWPKEKLSEAESTENLDRTANVEAQHHGSKTKGRGGASYDFAKTDLIRNLIFGLFIMCII